ncbi:hypothetical protein C8R43DRAFT_944853 [Mycena crocata]|nr:hypothetical protein C8R43DRAFT_944853 [Mycena crocata]
MATNKNSSNNPLQGKQFSAPGQGEWPPAGGGALRERGGSDAGRGPASLSPLPELTPSVNEGGRDELKSVNTPREENGSRLPDSPEPGPSLRRPGRPPSFGHEQPYSVADSSSEVQSTDVYHTGSGIEWDHDERAYQARPSPSRGSSVGTKGGRKKPRTNMADPQYANPPMDQVPDPREQQGVMWQTRAEDRQRRKVGRGRSHNHQHGHHVPPRRPTGPHKPEREDSWEQERDKAPERGAGGPPPDPSESSSSDGSDDGRKDDSSDDEKRREAKKAAEKAAAATAGGLPPFGDPSDDESSETSGEKEPVKKRKKHWGNGAPKMKKVGDPMLAAKQRQARRCTGAMVRIPTPEKYSGSKDIKTFERHTNAVLDWFHIMGICGPENNEKRIKIHGFYLTGDAHDWYNRDVVGVHREKREWTHLEMILGLFNEYLNHAGVQLATKEYDEVTFDTELGVRSFYNQLYVAACKMIVFPDKYGFRLKFYEGLPVWMIRKWIKRNITVEYSCDSRRGRG